MRKLEGTVISDKMTKTIIVAVTHWRRHSRYHKYYRITKRFKAHDDSGIYRAGDQVIIAEARPLSHHKRWRVIAKAGRPSADGTSVNEATET